MDIIETLKDAIDIVNFTLEHPDDKPQESLANCMHEQGVVYGSRLVLDHPAAAATGVAYDSKLTGAAFEQAKDHCNYDAYVDHSSYHVPSIGNPIGVFLDVVLQPTQLNVGEDQQFQARSFFAGAEVATGHAERQDQAEKALRDFDLGHNQVIADLLNQPPHPQVSPIDAFLQEREALYHELMYDAHHHARGASSCLDMGAGSYYNDHPANSFNDVGGSGSHGHSASPSDGASGGGSGSGTDSSSSSGSGGAGGI